MSIESLTALEPACTRAEALGLFDSLPPVRASELTGRWHGRELGTGHPMDGALAASGWYGKQFDGTERVHPLLFLDASGEIFAVDPRRVPLGLVGTVPPSLVARGRGLLRVLKPALRTRRHRARLREVEHRGVVTTAMVYDHLPIIDVFRRVDSDTVLGLMDFRDRPEPYFFVLVRD
ncbi:DUF4334 domain-containing protein [Nocardia sp. AG03]|uniref:DUF4334 domain-containing protein n=1 Tax=Nocardia sp. AG03 TaxID=3025312 RepID=UPI002418A521|nr:DUF4334 domain-containing protein [Nocardia sp. AG03]